MKTETLSEDYYECTRGCLVAFDHDILTMRYIETEVIDYEDERKESDA